MNHAHLRILDAALNRSSEGLRVIEDFARFVLDDPILTGQTKQLRHDLAEAASAIPSGDRHAARDTVADVGTRISTAAEGQRGDAWDVCAASLKRTEQALRSLEEYGKLVDADFATRCEAIRYRLYTLEKSLDIGRTSRERLATSTLCVLIEACDSAAEFEQLVRTLVAAGVGMIQLRAKELNDRDLVARARLLHNLTRSTLSLAIINDRADVAAIAAADGVHLGQEDLTVKDARAILGPRPLIGVSTHNIAQARQAVLDGANYLGAGPTFPSQTKAFDNFAGLDYLRHLAAEIRLPTYAIGGITADNLPDVLAAGITRIAVSSAITAATDPALAARNLLVMLESNRASQVAETVPTSLIPDP